MTLFNPSMTDAEILASLALVESYPLRMTRDRLSFRFHQLKRTRATLARYPSTQTLADAHALIDEALSIIDDNPY